MMNWATAFTLATILALVTGHGRVMDPVSRASAWRKGFGTPHNYDDDGLNCGGMAHQWSTNGGRCGICGDAYDLPSPRPHEIGGKYGEGVIVASFQPNSIITTSVQLTASHRGFWEFKICPDPEENNQGCFNKYPVELEDGGTKYYPTQGAGVYKVNYRLPQGLKCEHCVLQWRYTAGNNWGDCKNGTQGLGCGNQEQFGACSDISIGSGARPHHKRPQQDPTAPNIPVYIPIIPPNPHRPKPPSHPNQIQPDNRPTKNPIKPQVITHHKNPNQSQSGQSYPSYSQKRPTQNPHSNSRPPQNPHSNSRPPQNSHTNSRPPQNSHTNSRPPQNSHANSRPPQNSHTYSRPLQTPIHPGRPPPLPGRPKPLPPGLRGFLRQNSANALRFQKEKGSKKQRINSKKPRSKIPNYLQSAIKLYPAIKTYYQKYPELFNPYFYG